jgi:hypothetical protein
MFFKEIVARIINHITRDWKPVTNDRPSHLVFGKNSSVKPGQDQYGFTVKYLLNCLLIGKVSVANSWQNFFKQSGGKIRTLRKLFSPSLGI